MNRTIYIDYLKVFALISIVLVHSSGHYTDIDNINWEVANIYHSIGRAGVPLFFIISGALILSKIKISYLETINKTFYRIILPLIIWSLIYIIYKKIFIDTDINIFKHIIASFFRPESGHLWFMYTIAGMYLLYPILQDIERSKYKYIFILWVFSVSLIPFIHLLFTNENIQFKRNMFVYLGFPILGYLLLKAKIQKKMIITLLTILTLLLSLYLIIYLNQQFSIQYKEYTTYFHYNINFLILIYTISIFILFKLLFNSSKKQKISFFYKSILFLSKYSLGIYLIHIIILYFVQKNLIFIADINAKIILETLFTFLISALVILILSKNKYIKKII